MNHHHRTIYYSQIDVLPVELLHYIFGYFWAHEIFYAFFNLNDYFNAVLIDLNFSFLFSISNNSSIFVRSTLV